MKLKTPFSITLLLLFFLLSSPQKSHSQCFQIESILVDACGAQEGFNEMVRFKVGSTALNTSNLSVVWATTTLDWQGLIQNNFTQSVVATLNADILDAGGCGELLQPTSGVLPANATVILVTSFKMDTNLNSFGALTEDTYILFQNNPNEATGHFANSGTGTRTLTMHFGSCSDSVTYNRALLVNPTGATAAADGAIVNFNASGAATYINNDCSAPVPPFTVNAVQSTITACAGTTITLNGTAQGQQTVNWSAPNGTFSSPASLSTTYTIPSDAAGSTLPITLTATNSCGLSITDTVSVIVTPSVVPAFSPITPICFGQALAPLPTTSNNGVTGTWSPALNNTATTTYTFTPNGGQCATTATLLITVNPANTVPTFTAVAPICFGQALAPLPTTSNNGITGTWSPALNNSATTTYTFTPNAGQCAATATLVITVNPANTVPTFPAVAPICFGQALAPLPTTSNNGITGSWSPALNNSATTTYTFTPNAGQCAATTTLTITVNSANTVPTFSAVAPICIGEMLASLPTTSNNGISGTWSPALNNTTTTTYTFTPNAGQCATTTTLIITVHTVNTVPAFSAITPICLGQTLAPLPTTSNNGITGAWAPALNNSATTTYTFTPSAGQCATTATLIITVNPATTVPTFSAVVPICTGETLAPLPTTSNNGITGTWAPALNNTATTTYTFTPNAGQCATTATLIITVNPATTVPTFSAVGPICTGETLAALPTTSNNGITGTWSPALNNTATTTYTFTPAPGQCATTGLLTVAVLDKISPVFSIPTTICKGQVLPVLDLISDNGVSGTWNPSIITASGSYVFTPDANQCALPYTLNISFSEIDFEFTEGCKNGAFLIEASPLSNSFDPENAAYQWRTVSGNTIGSNEPTLNVTDLLNSTPEVEVFPITYELTVTTDEGCLKTKRIELFGAFCSIPKGISPNNDGKNDEWDLTGLGARELNLFNRYGTKVYHYKNYTNEWKGQSDKGEELPDGTYFYVIDQGSGQPLTGWVYLNKAY